jgi:hypothetical protein
MIRRALFDFFIEGTMLFSRQRLSTHRLEEF